MKKSYKVKLISIAITLVLLIFAMGGATYAWFTHNRVTTTDRVTSKTGDDSVELYVSSVGPDGFRQLKEADIIQVNSANKEKLFPVSTSDLKHFLYAGSSAGNVVSEFAEDTEGKYYYHGRIYLEAVITGQNTGKKLNLYLDTSEDAGGAPLQSEADEIINASRLGFTFDGADPVIISLSDNSNVGDEDYKTTTVVNGVEIGDNKVLSVDGGVLGYSDDPSMPLSDYTISISDGSAKIPASSLLTMESNKIYTVDIYYYLEGCDPDCNLALALEDVELHLSFYGVLN